MPAMEPALGVLLLWLLFGGTHVGLGAARVRAALVRRLGEGGFIALFSAVSAVSFAALVAYYATHRFEGAAGPGLAAVPAVRWTLLVLIGAGFVLMGPALAVYPRLPMALFGQPIRTPYGIERVTRHPFFMGVTLFGLGHMLLATHLAGTVFFAGFAALSIAGARAQDRKLAARRGEAYSAYLGATSLVPFGAVLAGRQRVVLRELPLVALAMGLGLALFLRAVHGSILSHGGAWFIGIVLAGAALAALSAWRRKRRLARAPAR
jgi:uncharacterized membrane protein